MVRTETDTWVGATSWKGDNSATTHANPTAASIAEHSPARDSIGSTTTRSTARTRCPSAEAIDTSHPIRPHKNGPSPEKTGTSQGTWRVPSRLSQRWKPKKPLVEGWCPTAAEPAYEPSPLPKRLVVPSRLSQRQNLSHPVLATCHGQTHAGRCCLTIS